MRTQLDEVHIKSRNSVADSLDRLRHFLSSPHCSVSGIANESDVKIMRIQEYGNSIMRPQFNGKLTATPEGCSLDGNFHLSVQASRVMTLWFLGVGLLIIVAVVRGIATKFSAWWMLPLGGVGVFLMGVLFLKFAKSYYRGDQVWIVQQLKAQLGDGVTQ